MGLGAAASGEKTTFLACKCLECLSVTEPDIKSLASSNNLLSDFELLPNASVLSVSTNESLSPLSAVLLPYDIPVH